VPLSAEDVERLVREGLSEGQQAALEVRGDLDWAFTVPAAGRVRAHAFRQRGVWGAVFRLIPAEIQSLEALGLPEVVGMLTERPRGLVLVTGPTGSGKSTTLAAMVDRINRTRPVHILTIEDPIEFVHHSQQALVTQRELLADTPSFPAALRAALREDPDVVLVGELRDRDTMEAALTLAETGHLTLGTLHTSSAPQTISRLIDAFPAHQQAQVRSQVALVLEGVICQALVPAMTGGRVAVLEILVATPAVRALIRDDKIHQIGSVMQTHRASHGMQTLNQALAAQVLAGRVRRDVALRITSHREELVAQLDRGGQAS
jgi:twitching motility protein PilT